MLKLNIAVIGCGEHSQESLLPSLAAIPEANIVALFDSDQENLRKASLWFPDANARRKPIQTADDLENLDAIIVAGPPQLHERISKISIDLKIPIFVEKPPTISTESLKSLANLAVENRVITCVGHNLRHSDAALEFNKTIKDERFGKPVAMEMRYMASKPRGVRWGLDSPLRSFLLSHANHAIDLMIYQMGKIKNTVAARVWPDINGGVAITVQFIFESGAVGNLLASSYAPFFNVSTSVLSDKGCIAEMNGLHEVTWIGDSDLGKRWTKNWRPRTLETGFHFAGYQTELESFFSAISQSPNNLNLVHPSFQDEVEIYQAMDSIESAINENQ